MCGVKFYQRLCSFFVGVEDVKFFALLVELIFGVSDLQLLGSALPLYALQI